MNAFTENKTCLWCGNPCEKYFKEIAPACAKMFGDDATAFRKRTAHECPDYVREPQRWFFYSDPAHTQYTQEDYDRGVKII